MHSSELSHNGQFVREESRKKPSQPHEKMLTPQPSNCNLVALFVG